MNILKLRHALRLKWTRGCLSLLAVLIFNQSAIANSKTPLSSTKCPAYRNGVQLVTKEQFLNANIADFLPQYQKGDAVDAERLFVSVLFIWILSKASRSNSPKDALNQKFNPENVEQCNIYVKSPLYKELNPKLNHYLLRSGF